LLLKGKAENLVVPISSRLCKRLDLLAILAAMATLGGCDLDWEKPDVSTPLPERFREAKPKEAPSIGSARDFAARFGSKELTSVVDQALENNYDIAAAVARISQADAQARVDEQQFRAAHPNSRDGVHREHGRRRVRHVDGYVQRKRLRDPIQYVQPRAERQLRDRFLGQERGRLEGRAAARQRQPVRSQRRRDRHDRLGLELLF
jgi:hypothetical protein